MSRARRPVTMIAGLVVVVAMSATATPPASAGRQVEEPPRVQTIRDAVGDVDRSAGAPRRAARATDVTRVRVVRESSELIVELRLVDLRGFGGLSQRATAVISGVGSPRQQFTTAGRGLVKTSVNGERRCGSASRRPRADVLRMTIPFRCVRTTPGRYPRFTTSASLTRSGSFEPLAVDRVRTIRAAPR